jgi:hypothetical protein
VKTPEFVVVGHVVRDLVADGSRLGGTATFAAVQAQRLGLRVGVVTRVGADVELGKVLPGVAVAGRPSECTTSFENIYQGAHRRQRVPAQAGQVTVEDVPVEWRRAPVVLLGPVFGEVPLGLGTVFSGSLVGVSGQGWLRGLDGAGRVRRQVWKGAPFWSGCRMLIVSEEDLGRRREQVDRWLVEVPLVLVTRDRRGARLHEEGRWRAIDAFPADEVDPTGAGDVFAAAFLVRYHETDNVGEAARFASAAAAFSVEAVGSEGIAERSAIEARMEGHKEIELR